MRRRLRGGGVVGRDGLAQCFGDPSLQVRWYLVAALGGDDLAQLDLEVEPLRARRTLVEVPADGLDERWAVRFASFVRSACGLEPQQATDDRRRARLCIRINFKDKLPPIYPGAINASSRKRGANSSEIVKRTIHELLARDR